MSNEVTSTVPIRVLVVAVVAVLVVGCARDKTGASSGASGFQERARDAGIAFRMHDLPLADPGVFRL